MNHLAILIAASLPLTVHAGAPFAKHTIDAEFANGYQVTTADIDSDGDPDVIALSTQPSQLVWYRNPDWCRVAVTTKTQRNVDCAPYDIDNDGDPDLAVASDFDLGNSTTGGALQWLECPADPASQQEWELHPIDAIPTSHRVRWADIEGDGQPELLNLPIVGVGAKAPDYAEGVVFNAYSIPTSPRTEPWKTRVVDNTLAMAHGMAIVDWNGDGRDDIVTASFHGVDLYSVHDTVFTKDWIGAGHAGARPKIGSSEVAPGRLASESIRFVAAIEPWHGNEVVVYAQPPTSIEPWPRTVIDATLDDGHALACIDTDGDGNDEIVAGGRGGQRSLYLYQWAKDECAWTRDTIDAGGMGAAGIVIDDIDNDGRLDIVAIGTTTHNVVWYGNTHND